MNEHDWYTIKESDIPQKPTGTTKTMQRSLAIIEALRPGTAVAVPIPAGMSSRGQRGSLTKAAKALGVQVAFTEVDNVIYVRLVNK